MTREQIKKAQDIINDIDVCNDFINAVKLYYSFELTNPGETFRNRLCASFRYMINHITNINSEEVDMLKIVNPYRDKEIIDDEIEFVKGLSELTKKYVEKLEAKVKNI